MPPRYRHGTGAFRHDEFYVWDLPGDAEAADGVVVRRHGMGVATLAPMRPSGRLQPEDHVGMRRLATDVRLQRSGGLGK